ADRAASEYLVRELAHLFPADLIVSEEAEPPRSRQTEAEPPRSRESEAEPPASAGAARVWYIDPIDGTKEFIRGGTDWTVMIGAAEDGEPVAGVVHRPLTGETY